VAGYYREADLFILPTLSDGYALTQLEAMAHGLPVLASRYCGAAVRPGENGFVIEDLSAAGIAEAILAARSGLPLEGVRGPDFTLDDLGRELLSL
jgi:glycosyltransferase involved in cell wall biosynthesis